MRRIAFSSAAALLLFLMCMSCYSPAKPDDDEYEEKPEFILADISEYSEDYDEVLFSETGEAIFTTYYESGKVDQYLIITGSDTLFVLFREDGMPELISDTKSHIIFGNFSNETAHIGIIDEDGEFTAVDWDAGVDWSEYISEISQVATRGEDRRENLISHCQSKVTSMLLGKIPAFNLPFSTAGHAAWIVSAFAYMASDNPTYQKVVECASKGVDISLNVAGAVAKYGFSWTAALVIADIYVIQHDVNLIVDGIRYHKFGKPWPEKYEYFTRTLEGGIWLGTTSGVYDWREQDGRVPIRMGVANFDISTLEIGIFSCPDWIQAQVVNQGYNSYLSYHLQPYDENSMWDRSDKIVVYVVGVANVDYDLEFSITQHGKVFSVPSYLILKNLDSYCLTVCSPSSESWSVSGYSSWLQVKEKHGLATSNDGEIEVMTTDLSKDNGSITLTVQSIAGGTYTVHIPVYAIDPTPHSCPDGNHPHAIDLGLSVKWRCCNVGAAVPEGYGNYYAWGEIEPKEIYSWDTYKWGYGNYIITKYCSNSFYGYNGFTDTKTVLDPEDDAAHVNLGGNWRMPTDAEWTELRERCTWTWTTQNGVNGRLVTGPNGNSIFLPAAGLRIDASLFDVGSGFYWSSSLSTDFPRSAWYVRFGSGLVSRYGSSRYDGQSVRPISE